MQPMKMERGESKEEQDGDYDYDDDNTFLLTYSMEQGHS